MSLTGSCVEVAHTHESKENQLICVDTQTCGCAQIEREGQRETGTGEGGSHLQLFFRLSRDFGFDPVILQIAPLCVQKCVLCNFADCE